MKSNVKASMILIILSVIFLAGCASSPYKKRIVEDGLGGEVERFFAYGNYCGGKYPANMGEIDSTGVKRTLDRFYPPADDLDSLCYAHDFCYEFQLGNNVSCDRVFIKMLINHQGEFTGKGCWNLTTDMTIAFFGKNWEKGNSNSETFSNRLVSTFLGLPVAAFWAALKYPATPFLSNPAEGTCNISSEPNYEAIYTEFETLYEKALFNDAHIKINIPVPVNISHNKAN